MYHEKKLKPFWIVVLVSGVFVSETQAQATRQVTINGQVMTIVDRQILAKVRADVSDSALSVFLSTNGAVAISRAQRNRRWVLIQTPSNRDVMTLREQWRRVPFFEKVGVNEVGGSAVEPNDPYYAGSLPPPNDYNHQWALKNIGQNPPSGLADADLDAEEAWDIEQGSASVKVAVLDSGIPLAVGGTTLLHPDLNDASRYLLGPDFTSETDGSVRDNYGHGTHVLGILAAQTNNLTGFAGVDWNCRVWSVQVFLGGGFGFPMWFYNAVAWVVNLNDVKVINFSGGFPQDDAGIVKEAVYLAFQNGVLICAAAHNQNSTLRYPARYASLYANVISVGATTPNDTKAYYSNVGPELVVSAPGGVENTQFNRTDSIFSSFPPYPHFYSNQGSPLTFGYLGGTSMATPMVSGVACLLFAKRPMLKAEDIRFVIAGSADKVSPDSYSTDLGRNDYLGHGRLNANWALKSVIPPYYDDCGKLWDAVARKPMEVHRKQGTDTDAFGTTPNTTLSTHPSEVIYRFHGLTGVDQTGNEVGYKLRVTFFDGKNPLGEGEVPPIDRVQDLYVDNELIDYHRNLPDSPQQFEWYVPSGTYAIDQSIDVRFVKVSGPDAAVAEIWIIEAPPFFGKENVRGRSDSHPLSFSLAQNYPNPFNPSTRIEYAIPKTSHVSLKVFDVLGREVATLVDEVQDTGFKSAEFSAGDLASGVYLYRLQAGESVQIRKLALLR